MPRTLHTIGLLALSLTAATACKSFDNCNTVVEGEIPEGCVDCVFTVNNGDGTVNITQKSTSNTCGLEDLDPSSSSDASISCDGGSITINGLTYTN